VICVGGFAFGVCSVVIGSVSLFFSSNSLYSIQLIKLRVTHRKYRDQEPQAQKASFFVTFLNTTPMKPLNTSVVGNRSLNPLK